MNIDAIVLQVSLLKPGECITFDRFMLCLMHDEPRSALATILLENRIAIELKDRVRERIVGSAYDLLAFEEPMTGNLTFERLKIPLTDGRLCYVSPDRRHLYTFDGTFWNRNEEAIKEHCERKRNESNHTRR